VRFVQQEGTWVRDRSKHRSAGRGSYLCSAACGNTVSKNKRFRGLAGTAALTEFGEASPQAQSNV
jgi:predicted RNA-binding protein YlxR (DUF448 family)